MSRTTAVKGAEPLWRRQKVLALRVFDTDWSRAAPWAQRAVNCVAQCDGLFANIIGAPHWRGPTVEYAPRLAARDSLRPGLAGVTTSDPLVSPAQKSDFCAVSMGWLTDREPLTQWYYDCPAPQPDSQIGASPPFVRTAETAPCAVLLVSICGTVRGCAVWCRCVDVGLSSVEHE